MSLPSWQWLTLYWPRPLDAELALGLLRQWAADSRSPVLALEARASSGQTTYRIGTLASPASLAGQVQRSVPFSHAVTSEVDRVPLQLAGRLRTSTRHRGLRIDHEASSRAVLSAMAGTRPDEQLVLQLLLGPRRSPLAVPTNSPSAVTQPWYVSAWFGNGDRLDGEKRSALRDKTSDQGFASTIRLGASAADAKRQRALILNLLAALRTAEAAGLRLYLDREPAKRLNDVRRPWRWPLRSNVSEILALSGWPVGDGELSGLPPQHPRLLRGAPSIKPNGRVLVKSAAPGDDRMLGLSVRDATQHSHLIGATGAGKSTLILNMIVQDIIAGHGLVLVDPKGDLVTDVLSRVPGNRQADIVVLNPIDRRAPVGLNPLSPMGGDPELAADGVLAVFHGLYPDAWGPRIQDVLQASLLTLAQRRDISLVMLPLLLTNDGFRRSITSTLNDPIALGPFWNWFESLTAAERQQAIAPVLTRLRALLMRKQLRAVLGQVTPRFDMQQVFTEKKVLLVSLSKGLIGPESASLLGSLVVSRLWQTILTRASVPQAQRHPVMIYVDEVQDYLHLDTDIADVFAQSRGYGTAWTVAHQYLGQLPTHLRSGIMANARSRVVFNVSEEDARVLARGAPDLVAEDFHALRKYEVYASLLTNGQRTPYASGLTLPPPPQTSNAAALRQLSRQQFGQPLDEIEASFARLMSTEARDEPLGRRPRRQS